MDEDENGLQLSLGLGCGGLSGKSKGKSGSSSDVWPDDADKCNKVENDIKSFFQVSTQKEDSSSGSHRTDIGKTQENFFNPLSAPEGDVNTSTHLNHRVLWDSSCNRSAEIDGERRSDADNKRKMFFEDITNAKKHELDTKGSEFPERKASYISITTEEGSTADNEDVAESEVEGSAQASHRGDSSKQSIGFRGPSNIHKEIHLYPDAGVMDLQSQNRLDGPSGAESKHMNSNYGVQSSVKPANILNVPFSVSMKESNPVGVHGTSGHHPPINMMQVMPPSNGECQKGVHSINVGSSPLTFGYSHVQLPTLDKNASWLMGNHSPQIHHLYAGSNPPGLDNLNDVPRQQIPRNMSENGLYDLRTLERTRGGDDRQSNKEEGSSSRTEDDSRRASMNLRPNDSSERSTAEGLSVDFSAIKPGIAADVKFGGSGSCPNLPWVSTTAPGPNGKTISGVTYRYSANQIKIVCACHGSHMSPDEFVRHASEENDNVGVSPFPNSNPAASAQS